MSNTRADAFDGKEVFCRSCKQLLCIVPRDQITDVELTCHCGAQMRVTYSPQGWRDIRVTDKARDAAAKVMDAELRLVRARKAYNRAVADIGRNAGKAFADGVAGSKAPITTADPEMVQEFRELDDGWAIISEGLPGVGRPNTRQSRWVTPWKNV